MSSRVLAAASVLAILAGAGCGSGGRAAPSAPASTPAASGSAAAGPALLLDRDFPDPDILRAGDTYYAYATNVVGVNVQVATSTDLATWTLLPGDALPTLGPWATPGRTWAPEVAAAPGGGFLLYYTAHSMDPDRQCIGLAAGTDPRGPFTPVGAGPLVCPAAEGGAIDAATFTDGDRRYLLWKNDGNAVGRDTWIQLAPLAADGRSLAGSPVRLIRQDRAFEGAVVEAPTLWRHGSRYVLFYSANDYGGDNYVTAYATAPSPAGPWTKASEPLLRTATYGGAVRGPGGQDVLTGPDGTDRIAFHGWDPTYTYRRLYLAVLDWSGDRPVTRRGRRGRRGRRRTRSPAR
jgi:arabinan endo-1,5-alpha-L-arabinosidase